MKLKDWDEKEQRQGNNEGKRPDRKTGVLSPLSLKLFLEDFAQNICKIWRLRTF